MLEESHVVYQLLRWFPKRLKLKKNLKEKNIAIISQKTTLNIGQRLWYLEYSISQECRSLR